MMSAATMADALQITLGVTKDFAEELAFRAGQLFQQAGVRMSPSELAQRIADAARVALERAALAVKFHVVSKTPVNMGGLQQAVHQEAREDGLERVIYGEGVVFATHEMNGSWKSLPPHQPLKQWVEVKLGISGKEGDGIAWAIAQKIKARGLTLPNVEGKGRMIARTKDEMESTDFHFEEFARTLKEELSKIPAA
jgi:hypothetical protein